MSAIMHDMIVLISFTVITIHFPFMVLGLGLVCSFLYIVYHIIMGLTIAYSIMFREWIGDYFIQLNGCIFGRVYTVGKK